MRTKNFRIYSCAVLSIAELIKYDPDLHNNGYYNLVDTSGKQTRVSVDNERAGYTGVLTVGTGTTLPTEDDYKLENKVDLTLVKQVPIWDSTNLILVATFKNNTSEAVRITEVAYQLTMMVILSFLATSEETDSRSFRFRDGKSTSRPYSSRKEG